MILYQAIKYFILDSCLTTFFDKFQKNLKINIPSINVPIIGSYYKELIGPYGECYEDMVCRQVILSRELHLSLDIDNFGDNEILYMFAKEGDILSNIVFIELVIRGSELPSWLLIP